MIPEGNPGALALTQPPVISLGLAIANTPRADRRRELLLWALHDDGRCESRRVCIEDFACDEIGKLILRDHPESTRRGLDYDIDQCVLIVAIYLAGVVGHPEGALQVGEVPFSRFRDAPRI